MGALGSLSKSATEAWHTTSEVALLGFGILLVIGLIGEIKSLPSLPRYKSFEWLVVIGVFGELLGDGGIFVFSGHLQTLDGLEIARLNTRAAEIGLRAADLELLIQPRYLTEAQQEAIASALHRFAGSDLLIGSHWNDIE